MELGTITKQVAKAVLEAQMVALDLFLMAMVALMVAVELVILVVVVVQVVDLDTSTILQ